ncbi:hypothetical protein [Streptomyces sp. H27-D2]|uniref:hypothetical protein n=1 Tax=Streptomyces sp. H27-D2 TaxID=3046304 RepID=UPI002DBE414E|nr:hypothetical protein [Streptomyces sp. H27-D2]MEC4016199.1 hypothetical protein [Streptomyces sp. H27-D2]
MILATTDHEAARRLAAVDRHPELAFADWARGSMAMLPAGRGWDVVRLDGDVLHTATRSRTPEVMRSVLPELGITGPVIHDPRMDVHYALVPAGTAEDWDDLPHARCLSDGHYIGVPAVERICAPGAYWLTRPTEPLCDVAALRALVAAVSTAPEE